MKIIIRIKGMVGIRRDIQETLGILRLRKKYSAILMHDKAEKLGMLKKIEGCVSYGDISKETLKELIEKRGRLAGNNPVKVDDKFIDDLIEGKAKLSDRNIKPFFRLHPPIKGFRKSTRRLSPKGILGENKNINELLRRML